MNADRNPLGAITVVVTAVAAAMFGTGLSPRGADAGDAPSALEVTDQTFAVAAGSDLRLDLVLTGTPAVLDAVAVAATTTTTATTTTSTTTSTSVAPATPAAAATTVAPAAPPPPVTTVADAAGFSAPRTAPPATDAGTVIVTLHDPVDDIDDVGGIDSGDVGDEVDSAAVALDLAVDTEAGSATGTVAIPLALDDAASDAVLDAGGTGIHPLTIEVNIGGEVIASAHTFILVTDPDDDTTDTLPIAVLATVDDPGPWADAETSAAATAALEHLLAVADATTAPLTISLPPSVARPAATPDEADPTSSTPEGTDPGAVADSSPAETSASTAADGSAAPADPPDERLADRLIGDELLARPLVPLDASSIVGIGRTQLFTDQLRAGEEVLATASPQSTPSRSVWIATEPITQGGADALRDLGVQMVVLPADVAADMEIDSDLFAIALADGATLPGIVVSPLGERLAAPANGASANEAAVRLLVEALLEHEAGAAPALVLAPGDSLPDAAVTASFARHAAETPGVRVVAASQMIGAVAAAARDDVVAAAAEPDVDLTARDAAIDAVQESADAARSMLVDPAPAAAWDGDFVRLLATTLDDETASQRLATIRNEIDGYLEAVVPPERFTFRITGTSSDLPLRIVNNSDQVLTVVVRVASPKLETDDLRQDLDPGENTVKVPVTARSNGTFSVEVSVLTPTNVELSRPVVLKADVTGLSGLSRVITIAALLALASWWYSHFRKRRRSRAGDSSSAVRLEPGPTLSPDAAESRGPG